MWFEDEFEYVNNKGEVFYVQVEGRHYEDEHYAGRYYSEVSDVRISTDEGELVDKTHPDFTKIVETAMYRDYDLDWDNKHSGDYYEDSY